MDVLRGYDPISINVDPTYYKIQCDVNHNSHPIGLCAMMYECQDHYIVDIKKTQGNQIEFMNLCKKIMDPDTGLGCMIDYEDTK